MNCPMFKKADAVLLAVLVIAAALLFLIMSPRESEKSRIVVRTKYETQTYSFSTVGKYTFDTADGYNTIVIEDGKVYMDGADCRGGDCLRCKPISKVGETIVCLPHCFSVTIEGTDSKSPDAVLK